MDLATFIFQQDNTSVHTAGIVNRFFAESKITIMKWTPSSPDLNPIENLWKQMKYQLNQYPEAPNSMQELWKRLQDIWAEITADYIHELYESMPRRMREVYKNKGGCTKY